MIYLEIIGIQTFLLCYYLMITLLLPSKNRIRKRTNKETDDQIFWIKYRAFSRVIRSGIKIIEYDLPTFPANILKEFFGIYLKFIFLELLI